MFLLLHQNSLFALDMCLFDIPFSWPNFPFLPLKRLKDTGVEIGFLCDLKTTLHQVGKENVVYIGDIAKNLAESISLKDFIMKFNKIHYNSIEEVKTDGWVLF